MEMDKSNGDLSHLKLEIRVDRLSDFSLDLPCDNLIFIRYYIVAGNGERIRVDTREVSPSVIPVWDEIAAMECRGRSVGEVLEPHTAVFELRRRPRAGSLISSGSKLLGRAEIAWKEVLASPKMSMRRCVRFGSLSSEWSRGGVKSTPGLLVEMKVEAMAMEFSAASGSTQRVGMEKCGRRRKSEGFGSEDEMRLAAATMNAW
ncbi:uncharacterized protein LOC122013663 [Zingiber officinale]|nr:uncharacterized protein LOC122013663 [Zingiber officinale]